MRWGVIGLLTAVVVSSGCQEQLTTPAQCPELCPGGEPVVIDEVFTPVAGADSSYRGYVQAHEAAGLLVSNGLQGFEELALVRFSRRPDSVTVADAPRSYTIDSVTLNFVVLARDTNLTGLQLLLYRLSPSTDSSTSYAAVAPALVAESLVATIDVPDTLRRGPVRALLQGADLGRVQIPPADSGRLALGVRIASATPTGVRVGALESGTGAIFTTYVTADAPDDGTDRQRTLTVGTAFNTFVSEVTPVGDTTLLAVGGEPSARTILRFSLPPRIRDSATIIRATLELTPVAPISGLPTDPAVLQARAVLADVGAKSPVSPTVGLSQRFPPPVDTLEVGAAVVSLEAVRLVELWLGATSRPSALMLSLTPEHEAASFTRPVFHSSRAADPALRPRLRLSYLLSFPFETP